MDTIAIVGLGYVGLPLAVAFGGQQKTIGFDLNEHKLAHYRAGRDPSGEVTPEQLAQALAGAIRHLSNQPEERARLSAGARARALQLGSRPTKVSWLLELYHSILQEQDTTKRSA